KSLGNCTTSCVSASTPPADAPTTIMSWPSMHTILGVGACESLSPRMLLPRPASCMPTQQSALPALACFRMTLSSLTMREDHRASTHAISGSDREQNTASMMRTYYHSTVYGIISRPVQTALPLTLYHA